jgi:hypothetical protein
MKKLNELCNKLADLLLYTIAAGLILWGAYICYRYDVNVVKQGIKEDRKEAHEKN